MSRSILLAGALAASLLSAKEPLPQAISDVLFHSCLDCHDEASSKGDINLETAHINWSDPHQRHLWEKVLEVSRDGLMPPPDKDQPTTEERQALTSFLDTTLLKHTPIGGTPPRRLNRDEYLASVRKLFQLPKFELPVGFPRDSVSHGFNNLGEGLVLSPPLLEGYSEVATLVADQLFPPQKPPATSAKSTAGPGDMVISFSASTVRGDALRLASRCNTIMRSSTWPSRIEVQHSGTYRLTLSASTFKPTSKDPLILEVRARTLSSSDRSGATSFRLLKEIPVTSESPESVTFEADLYDGETILLRWLNAEMDHDKKPLTEHITALFKKDKRFLAAWQKAVFPDGLKKKPSTNILRGANGYRILSEALADPNLDLSQATLDSPTTKKLLALFNSNAGTFNLADALCHHYFENGPSLEFHHLTLEGPLKLVDGPNDIRQKRLRRQLIGPHKAGQGDKAFARQFLTNFLPRAFRRPVDDTTIDSFLSIATTHWESGHHFDDGMHLLLRSILISPRFLYRNLGDGALDNHDLASRLSFFLTQGPPDKTLIDLANRSRLSQDAILKREANRLLPKSASQPMIRSFLGQWLDLNLLSELMPDPGFRFSEAELKTAHREAEAFFTEILRQNLPLKTFIDPDFNYTTINFAKRNYKYTPDFKTKNDKPPTKKDLAAFRKYPLPPGHKHGGLLGMSAVMLVTANGVDTQPVLRGTWFLENILGRPTPEPPKDVPALTPDTRGATTPRELLTKHTSDTNCASCHQRIDPFGFLLENYDPVGRWRTKWPKINKPINSAVTLPDGTQLKDASELKPWLVDNIQLFGQCLSEKLLTYATGRLPNYAEKAEIQKIVQANLNDKKGFRDLLLTLIQSKTFRTK